MYCTDLEVNYFNSNYVVKVQGFIALYVGGEVDIFTLLEVMKLYTESEKVK